MFKPHYGNCSCCGKEGLIVVKSGLIQICHQKKKKLRYINNNKNRVYKKNVQYKKCKWCNKDFYVPPKGVGVIYCSHKCFNIGRIKKTVLKKCENCENEFPIQYAESNEKYCSVKCYNEKRHNPNRKNPDYFKEYGKEYYKKNYDKIKEKQALRYEKERQERIRVRAEKNAEIAKVHPLLVSKGIRPKIGKIKKCKNCNKEIYVGPNRLSFKNIFCGRTCFLNHEKEKSKRICAICGGDFHCTPSQLKCRNRKTCSIKCRAIYQTRQAEERRLKNPPTQGQLNRQLRYSKESEDWRKAVFKRDDYTCQKCGARNGRGKPVVYLEAHHKKGWAQYPNLRFDIDNGETLCKRCHMKENTGRPPKEKGIKDLIKDLDKWFSLFVRLRYADENGLVQCFTSGKILHYKHSQAGHFISRRHLSTRWDEYNVQVQSVHENIFNQGNAPVFAQKLKEKYGQSVVDVLLIKKSNKFKAGKFELGLLIEEYKKKVEDLKQKKGL